MHGNDEIRIKNASNNDLLLQTSQLPLVIDVTTTLKHPRPVAKTLAHFPKRFAVCSLTLLHDTRTELYPSGLKT